MTPVEVPGGTKRSLTSIRKIKHNFEFKENNRVYNFDLKEKQGRGEGKFPRRRCCRWLARFGQYRQIQNITEEFRILGVTKPQIVPDLHISLQSSKW